MTKRKSWTDRELEILEKKYVKIPIDEMMELLPDRSKYAIQWKASSMGLLIRDGKESGASVKKIINLTKEQADYLEKKRNGSRIVREALDQYIQKNP